MTDLFHQLSSSARSLSAHRVAQATASHNIENVNTPGYARQRTDLTAVTPAAFVGGSFIGRGVEVAGVSAARDRFLDAQVAPALATGAFSDARAGTLTAVTALDPEAPGGIPTTLGNFFAAMRELARNPSDSGARRGFVQNAEQLSFSFNRTAAQLNTALSAADQDLNSKAQQANLLSSQVASLNAQIRVAQAGGGAPPNDLLDARRLAAEELVAMTGAQVLSQGSDLTVQLGSTALVTGDRSATLGTRSVAGRAVLTATTTSGVTSDVSPAVLSGSMGGLVSARDELGARLDDLDALAFEFTTALNTVHSGGIALDGSSGRDLFVTGPQPGAAARVRVESTLSADPDLVGASGTGAAGDNGAVLQMQVLEQQSLPSGRDPAGALAAIVEQFGAAAAGALQDQQGDAAVRDSILSLRDSQMGVSIDEELIEMTKAQRAFEAVSKVIQTADQMLETLLSLR